MNAFIPRQDVFDAITSSLLQHEKNRLTYSKMYQSVNKILGYTLSHRDFASHIEHLTNEGILNREEKDSEKKRGTRVDYSLTQAAKKAHQLRILGIDEETEKRRGLCQLMVFFEIYKRGKLLNQNQLDKFLVQIGVSKTSLKEIENNGLQSSTYKLLSSLRNNTVTFFKPLKGVEITRYLQNDSTGDVTKYVYYVVELGFSPGEFVVYLKKLRNLRAPRPFSQFPPIVPYVGYTKYDEEEVEDSLQSFRKAGLIRPIESATSKEIRFRIADECLQELLHSIWMLHILQFHRLIAKLCYIKAPNEKEKAYLTLLLGDRRSDYIIALANNTRRTFKAKSKTQIKAKQRLISKSDKNTGKVIELLNERFGSVIQENKLLLGSLIERIRFKPSLE